MVAEVLRPLQNRLLSNARFDRDECLVRFAERDNTITESEQGIIGATSNVLPRVPLGPTLANEDVACFDNLS